MHCTVSLISQLEKTLKKSVDICELLSMVETLRNFLAVAGGSEDEELLARMNRLQLAPTVGIKILEKVGMLLDWGRGLFFVCLTRELVFSPGGLGISICAAGGRGGATLTEKNPFKKKKYRFNKI